jgi:hypothetical protein
MNEHIEKLITQPLDIKFMLSEALAELKIINEHLDKLLGVEE